ncbi:hypothetical protein Scep_013481 [Stephania cephalantha]|uniref:Uncharacterized protein n=1 Tax=Stephania cephalantha TaxID=152367 RepID=A0AAP0JIW3_9MAGN
MRANSSQLDGGHHQATENEIEILGEREKQIVIASKKKDSSKPKFPHNYKDIIKEADSSISEVSPKKILDRLHSGWKMTEGWDKLLTLNKGCTPTLNPLEM